MSILTALFTAFLLLRILVAVTNLLTRPWLAEYKVKGKKYEGQNLDLNESRLELFASRKCLVSVLIPARNEEKNIGQLLESLARLYPPSGLLNMEVIVYDDLSSDNTLSVVEDFCDSDKRFSLIKGKSLPTEWLGKNHACHKLSLAAKGDYLMFLDADVAVDEYLILSALKHMQKNQLALLSIFPQQIMKSFGERITVPLMNWILVSLLPMILTRISSRPSFSAANGQFMLFDASVYRQFQFHQMVKHHKVEDIEIFRRMKQLKLPVQTILSNGMIQCRMYTGLRDAINGFSKNVFGFFGGSASAALIFALATTLGFIPVWYVMGTMWVLAYLTATLFLRVLVSLASRQPVLQNILLAPLQQIAFLMVITVALINKLRGATTWKGRVIK